MIIVPELETVVILTPRTGSGSTNRAILDKYPKAMMLYRHMEADGVPQAYDRWEKVGVVRNPLDRMWSLYKFLGSLSGPYDPEYIEAMRSSADRPFETWLLHNEVVFNTMYLSGCQGRFDPKYAVRHPMPENRKSQFIHLRPDLGTTVYKFDELDKFADRLGIQLDKHNSTDIEPVPELSATGADYIEKIFAWDHSAS
jgi:hypothetical protein